MRILAIDAHKTISYCVFHGGTPTLARTFRDVTPGTVYDVFRSEKFQGPLYELENAVIEVPDSWSRDGKNMRAMMGVNAIAYSLGNLFRCCAEAVHYVPVSEWKGQKSKFLTDWESVVEMKAMGIDDDIARNEHERDALALGLWWLRQRAISTTITEGG